MFYPNQPNFCGVKKQNALNYQREPCAEEITWEHFIIDFVSIPPHPHCAPVFLDFLPPYSFFFFFSREENGNKGSSCLLILEILQAHLWTQTHKDCVSNRSNFLFTEHKAVYWQRWILGHPSHPVAQLRENISDRSSLQPYGIPPLWEITGAEGGWERCNDDGGGRKMLLSPAAVLFMSFPPGMGTLRSFFRLLIPSSNLPQPRGGA